MTNERPMGSFPNVPREAPATLVGRLAPSPTGHLHLGHAFAFLVAWWSVRSRKGSIVLRIEDVDAGRSSAELIDQCQQDLRWLGIDWERVRIQSSRSRLLVAAAQALARRGLAYACTCSRKDIAQSVRGAPQQGVVESRYPGTCRGRYPSLGEAETISGKAAGLRFFVPPGEVRFEDRVYGWYGEDVAATVGDVLVLRRDKDPCYQLAVVVDDDYDGVTEVVRGRDLLASTARQILLAEAWGHQVPSYAHLPLVCDHTGRRLAKRRDDLSLAHLRASGIPSENIVRWAASCAGMSDCNGVRTASDAIERFAWRNVAREDILLPPDPFALLRSFAPR